MLDYVNHNDESADLVVLAVKITCSCFYCLPWDLAVAFSGDGGYFFGGFWIREIAYDHTCKPQLTILKLILFLGWALYSIVMWESPWMSRCKATENSPYLREHFVPQKFKARSVTLEVFSLCFTWSWLQSWRVIC